MSQITNPEVVAWVEIIHQQLLTIPSALKTSLQIEGGTEQDLQKTIEAAEKILKAPSIKQDLYKEVDRLALSTRNINVVYRELIKDNLETLIHHLFFTIIPSLKTEETLLYAIQDQKVTILANIKREVFSEPDRTNRKDFEEEKKVQPKTNSTPSTIESPEALIHKTFSNLTIYTGNKYRGMISAEVGDKVQAGFKFLCDHRKTKESIAEYIGLIDAISPYYPNRLTIIFKLFFEKTTELVSKTFPDLIKTAEFAPYLDELTEDLFQFELGEAKNNSIARTIEYEQALLNLQSLNNFI